MQTQSLKTLEILLPVKEANRWQKAWTKIVRWLNTQETFRELRKLDDHLLQDIGITRSKIEEEMTRPLWKS